MNWNRAIAMTLVCVVGILGMAHADEAAEAGRAILDAHKDAVVTVKLVIKMRYSMGGRSDERETKSEVTGTVIDPSGLVVASLFATDPASAAKNMAAMDEASGYSMEAEIKDAKILTPDGDEIDAELVLRDNDLDLAFMRPKEKAEKPFASVDLKDAGQPQVLDPLIGISRMGKVANRVHGAIVDRVEAVVEKPRTFYVPAGAGMNEASLGAPVFTLDGKIAGIAVLRMVRSKGARGMFGGGGNTLMIVLPAADVQEVAEHAPEHAEKTRRRRPERRPERH